MGVGRGAVAQHFCYDVCASPLRRPELFEHEQAGPFTHDKTSAVAIERPRRGVRGEGPEAHEGRDGQRVHTRLRPPCKHAVGKAQADEVEGVAYRVRACGAGCCNRV